jgi:hypothetical protein
VNLATITKMDIQPKFPEYIEEKAFRMHLEYAWQKKDLKLLFDHCLEAGISILGGEAWVVRKIIECTSDEPTERNIDLRYRQDLTILGRTQTHVIYGIFPFKDGTNGLFSWNCSPRRNNQSWLDYVNITLEETISIIQTGNLEENVIQKYSGNVYYNLAFEQEDSL